jgi:hypothetical protein
MHHSPMSDSVRRNQAPIKPFLISYDSGPEFSLEHWCELSGSVEHGDDELHRYVFMDELEFVSK